MKILIRAFCVSIALAICVLPLSVVATESAPISPEASQSTCIPDQEPSVDTTVPQEGVSSAPSINIPAEVTCSLISLLGVVISTLVSKSVSKNTTAKEIEKMKLSWDREDLVSSEEDFSKMASSVGKYVSTLHTALKRDALGEIASVRAKENGDLALALDRLYIAVSEGNVHDVNKCLTNVINEKRKLKTKGATEASR